ncbi:uncharacterized protein LOC120412359 isoform X3 [Culex pipiens pallens]|nr:uncharacterized protein LOC120412359 isoform X3 [Culex pipiens pallens]
MRVVLDATERIQGSGREVVVDNFFTSVEAAKKCRERGLFLTGTLRKCKPDIPREMLPSRTRTVHSSIFGYNSDLTITSYVPKKNRAVVFLSNNPNLCGVGETTSKKKTVVNLHYNVGKAPVDNLDKSTREFSTARKTKRWPNRMMMDIVDLAMHNAEILHHLKYPEWRASTRQSRFKFFQKLSYELAYDYVRSRADAAVDGCIHNDLKQDFQTFFAEFERLSTYESEATYKAMCVICTGDKELKPCTKCEVLVCQNHQRSKMEYLCVGCQGETLNNRGIETKSMCYYCVEEVKRSRVKCSTCKVCCCDQHRAEISFKVCPDCRS